MTWGFKHGGSTMELKSFLHDDSFSDLKQSEFNTNSKEDTSEHSHFIKNYNSIMSAMLYGTVGLFMGFANKAVLLEWPYSNTLLMLQMVASILILYILRCLGLIVVRPFELKSARNLAWVVLFYNANVAFALAAVQSLTIPVYHVMKRLTPVMVIIGKFLLGDAFPPFQVVCSVLTVVAGCIISGLGDFSFDGQGYMMAIMSCILQTVYLLLVEKSGSEKGYTSNELLHYNAILSLPVLIVIIIITGEAKESLPILFSADVNAPSILSLNFAILFFTSLILGSLLNYALFLCTINNSALTTTIVGTMRSVIGTVLGFFVLGGVKANVLIVIGVTTNTLGGIWYTALKYNRQKSTTPLSTPKATPSKFFNSGDHLKMNGNKSPPPDQSSI